MFLRCRRNHQRKSKTSTVSDPSTTPSKNIHRTKKRRSRSKPRRKMKIDPLHSHVGIDIPNAEEWRVKRIPDHSKPLAWVKRDSKWFLGTTGPYMDFAVPYLDRLGREVGMQLYADQSTLPSYVASYLSTRIRRIRVEVMNDKKVRRKHKNGAITLGARISILSFLIGSDYYISRFKALAGKSGGFKILNGMIRNVVSKLSDDKWFVYRHISSQIQWLDLRGSSRSPRDKLKVRKSVLTRADTLGRVTTDYVHGIYSTVHHIVFGHGCNVSYNRLLV